MTPRPIHHWKTFWLGIIVLLALGFAWLRSLLSLDYTPLGPWMAVGQGGGKIAFLWDANGYPGHYAVTEKLYLHQSPFGPPSDFKAYGYDYLFLVFAHWYLILLFFLLWLTFLAWRRQEMKALAKAQAEANADIAAITKPQTQPQPPPVQNRSTDPNFLKRRIATDDS
ncbi:hypothetical protein [Luteolibacter soli]|uniref:Uncharacterized protein n=1 Tax=Luteolibacter soli TaxID=3135280 RepID=A0ABU9AYB8_9BACT